MKLASAILVAPIKLLGVPASKELPGDALGVELTADYAAQLLEVHQHGKLVTLRPFAGVVDMVPATDSVKCPDCGKGFPNANSLGGHRRHCGKSA